MVNHDIPPPVAADARPRRNQQRLAAVSAILLGIFGWIIWFVALGVESDAGYPDGLACTAWAEGSAEYTSCMLGEERGGAIAWAVTVALATLGLTMIIRVRLIARAARANRPLVFVGLFMSGSLALAAAATLGRGVSGGFYENRAGPVFWLAASAIACSIGGGLGWFLTRRGERK